MTSFGYTQGVFQLNKSGYWFQLVTYPLINLISGRFPICGIYPINNSVGLPELVFPWKGGIPLKDWGRSASTYHHTVLFFLQAKPSPCYRWWRGELSPLAATTHKPPHACIGFYRWSPLSAIPGANRSPHSKMIPPFESLCKCSIGRPSICNLLATSAQLWCVSKQQHVLGTMLLDNEGMR